MPAEAIKAEPIESQNNDTTDELSVSPISDGAPDIGMRANSLLKLIDEFKTITDRALAAAAREAESADAIKEYKDLEISALQEQLREKDAALLARDEASKTIEATHQTRIEALEGHLREKESELENRNGELRNLKTEVEDLLSRLSRTELALKDAEFRATRSAAHFEPRIAELELQLKESEEALRAKESAVRDTESAFNAQIQDLQNNLRDAHAQLESRDAELKEKAALLEAAAGQQTEIAKLIDRLNSECENLSRELHDKKQRLSQFEKKDGRSAGGERVWKKVFGR